MPVLSSSQSIFLIIVRRCSSLGDFLPRLVKGSKFVYGCSEASAEGKVVVPDAAPVDYSLMPPDKIVLLSGSRRSGGFALTTVSLLKDSFLSRIFDEHPELAAFRLREGETVVVSGGPCCWVTIEEDGLHNCPRRNFKTVWSCVWGIICLLGEAVLL